MSSIQMGAPAIHEAVKTEWLSEANPAFETGLESSQEVFSHLVAAMERAGVPSTQELGDTNSLLQPTTSYAVGVSSALVGEGKTTIALNLALSTARCTHKRVCLIDLGLAGDRVLARTGAASRTTGVIHVLEGSAETFTTIKLRDHEELTIIPAGKAPDSAARLARSPRMEGLFLAIRRAFDLIIVDMPAVSTHYALPLAAHMDGVIMVTRASVTPAEVVTHAVDYIGRDKVLGIVLNRVKFSGPRWLRERLMRR